MKDLLIVVSGAPGAGKTSVAVPLAQEMGLPLFAKDTIKERLGDVLGARDMEESQRLGAAANEVLFALAETNGAAVVESAWLPELARPRFEAMQRPIVEVFCDVPPEVAMERYDERAGSRHPVHFDHEQLGNLQGWLDRATPIVGTAWPVIRVDTTKPVDIKALAETIRGTGR
jgi:predicted kinase